ncbi:hypothetical protein, variant [Verruconis gallopava]|uniref:Mediator of RNA polymerase II transcription subunit 16 n=1 Tax=Verruconis gallopava TaxID=253628 RepID=A0A0D1Z0X7_9PEZI|nr:hypothetical protein, variant [Verruconis gallopava]KIW06622.1 hypothetical protein, variant [Verruconis gallopava]
MRWNRSKIAWSRFGCIASVAEDARHINLRVLMRNPKSGEWTLPKPTEIWPSMPDSHEIVHLAYSAMGNDLAVVDSGGRIMLYTTGLTLGSMIPVHVALNDSSDEMNTIVGMHWLPVFLHNSKVFSFFFRSASRNSDTWTAKIQQYHTPGPHNPLEGKSALVCLTRKGTLRLLWQARNNQWSETTVELEDASLATSCSFTHASFSPENDGLLLIAHQLCRATRLYQLRINWNMPPKQENDSQNLTALPNPVLDVRSLLEEHFMSPQNLPNHSQDDTLATTNGNNVDSMYEFHLAKLLFVPPAPDQGTKEPTLQTILAVFTIVPPSHEGMMVDPSQRWGLASTIISRWEVQRDVGDNLSTCFDQLSVKKKAAAGVPLKHGTRLKRLDDVVVSPAVLMITPVRNNTMFALTLSDGSVQFRYRNTMDVVLPDESPDEVQSLTQSGFSFHHIDPCLHTAFSPSACVLATLTAEGQVKLEKMQYTNSSLNDIDENDSKHDAIAAIIALQYSSACMQYKVTDDILAILPANLGTSLTRMIVALCMRFLNVEFDVISGDYQQQILPLFRNHLSFRCFSLQNALGAADKTGPRKLSARLAWITLNLRHVSQSIFFHLRSDQALKYDSAISFVGLFKWYLDLCCYLLQELNSLHYAIKHEAHLGRPGREKDRDWIQEQIQKRHSPAMILLLSSMPRVFLRMTFRPLRHGYMHASNGFRSSTAMEQKNAFHKLLNTFHNSPVNQQSFGALEDFINEIDISIKNAYKTASLSVQDRSAIEKDMLLTLRIPPVLMPTVTAILTVSLDGLMSKVDPGKVHIHDISWLGLTDDHRTKKFNESRTIDVIRKVPLVSTVKLRVCPRCGSVMEDLAHGVGHHQPWVLQSHKICVCLSSWANPDGN